MAGADRSGTGPARVPGTEPIRVAVIGLGWAGRQIWLPSLAAHPAYRVTAVVDPHDSALTVAAELAPGARRCHSARQVDREMADLAIVAVPNDAHTVTAEQVLGHDVAAFVEKPVCLSVAELHRLHTAERRSRGRLLAGSAGRYRADVRTLRSIVPTLGTIRLVELSWVRARGIPRQGGWFTRARRSGGGALVDLGWHLLDVGLDLIGRPDIAQGTAVLSADFVTDSRWDANWRGPGARRPHTIRSSFVRSQAHSGRGRPCGTRRA